MGFAVGDDDDFRVRYQPPKETAAAANVEDRAQPLPVDHTVQATSNPFTGIASQSIDRRPQTPVSGMGARRAPEPELRAHSEFERSADAYARAGIDVLPVLGTGLCGKTTKPMSLVEIAAAAFHIPAGEVEPAHIDALTTRNPDLARVVQVPKGTVLDLGFAQGGLKTYRSALVASTGALDRTLDTARRSWPGEQGYLTPDQLRQAVALRDALHQEIERVDTEAKALDVDADVKRAGRTAERAPSSEAVADGFLKAHQKAKALEARVPGITAQVEVAYANALARWADEALREGDAAAAARAYETALETLKPLSSALRTPELVRRSAQLHVRAALAASAMPVSPDTPRPEVQQIEKRIHRHFEAAKAIVGETGLAADQKLVLADFAARSGEPGLRRKRLREAFGETLGTTTAGLEAMLPIDRKKAATPDGCATRAAEIARRPPEERERIVSIALDLADAYDAEGTDSHAAALISLLVAVDEKTPLNPEQRLQLTTLLAQRDLAAGELLRAQAELEGVRKAAVNLPGTSEQRKIEIQMRALQSEALVHANLAASDHGRRSTSLEALDRIRVEVEALPISERARAGFVILEMNAALESNQSARAELLYQHLVETYAEVPEVRRVVSGFGSKRVGSAEAFIKVLMSEAASTSFKETAAVTAIGAGVGAVVGLVFFGAGAAPGAAIGAGAAAALVAGSAGAGFLLARNLIRGAGSIRQALSTGLAAQGWGQTALDGISVGLDLASIAAPVRGARVVGGAGLRVIAFGSKVELDEARAVFNALRDQIVRVGGTSLSEKEIAGLAQEMLLKRFSNATLGFGGRKVQAAAISAMAGTFAHGFYAIASDPDLTPEARAKAYDAFTAQLGENALKLGFLWGASHLVHRLALEPVGAQRSLRAELARVATARPALRLVDDATYRRLAIAHGASSDAAFFDPVMGQAVVRRSAGRAAIETAAVHEIVHARFHELPPSERRAVVSAFTESPAWPQIQAELLAMHPDLKGRTAVELVDELVAMLHAEPKASGRLAALARPILDAPEMRRAGLSRGPKLDFDALLAKSGADIGPHPYQRKSDAAEAVDSHLLELKENGELEPVVEDAKRHAVVVAPRTPTEAEMKDLLAHADSKNLSSVRIDTDGGKVHRLYKNAGGWDTNDQALLEAAPSLFPRRAKAADVGPSGRWRIEGVVDGKGAARIAHQIESAVRSGDVLEVVSARGKPLASVRRESGRTTITLSPELAAHGTLKTKLAGLVEASLAGTNDVAIHIGDLATIERTGGAVTFHSAQLLGAVRGIFVEYLVARTKGLAPEEARRLFDRATAQAARVRIAKAKPTDENVAALEKYRSEADWWRAWEKGADNLGKFTTTGDGGPRLSDALRRIRESSEPSGLRLGGLAQVAEGQNAFALLEIARERPDQIRWTVDQVNAYMGEKVRGAFVDMLGRGAGVLGADAAAGAHEFRTFEWLHREVGRDPRISKSFVLTVLPEDPTHGLAKTSTPDFVADLGEGRFLVCDAKRMDYRHIGSKRDAFEKGAEQVLADGFLPAGAKRWGMISVEAYGTSGSAEAIEAKVANTARDPIAEIRSRLRGAPDIFVGLRAQGRPLVVLDPARDHRPMTAAEFLTHLGVS